jgi:hypothetical protein
MKYSWRTARWESRFVLVLETKYVATGSPPANDHFSYDLGISPALPWSPGRLRGQVGELALSPMTVEIALP